MCHYPFGGSCCVEAKSGTLSIDRYWLLPPHHPGKKGAEVGLRANSLPPCPEGVHNIIYDKRIPCMGAKGSLYQGPNSLQDLLSN